MPKLKSDKPHYTGHRKRLRDRFLKGGGAALPVLILFGFFGTAGSLSYVGLAHNFPPHLAGRVYTTTNLLVFIVAFTGQWGIGLIINLWPEVSDGYFAPIGYQIAFGAILGVQLLAFLWIWISKLIWPKI